MTKMLGILGGMGPIVSAEFLKTIYEHTTQSREQDFPKCVVISDPNVPDRTEAILSGLDEKLFDNLKKSLQKLLVLEADKIVVTCLTSHYLFPRLPFHIQNKIISLVDLIIHQVQITKKPTLLLCTNGTYMSGVFKAHPDWSLVEPFIVMPNEKDREQIHNLIYEIKKTGAKDSSVNALKDLLNHYPVQSCIAGCTEFHLVNKYLCQKKGMDRPFEIIDPLQTLAMNLQRYLHDQ